MPALASPTETTAPTAPTAELTSARPELTLRLPDGSEPEVKVSAVRDRVAELEAAPGAAPVMPVGLIARAALPVKGLGKPLSAHVRVLWRQVSDGGRHRYGISLPALGERGGALTAALCAAFNRRACQRVRPEPLAHPLVTIDGGAGLRACGPLNDISLGGLSVQVATEVENDFASIDLVDVTVHLPASGRPVRLAGRIRSRRLCGTRVRYGVEFEPASGNRSAVLDYVLARRDECLRRASRTVAPEQL